MHVVGLSHFEAFLASHPDCGATEILKAFAAEIIGRSWPTPAAMARDYPLASFDSLPLVAFSLSPCPVIVDCLVDFNTRTILIDRCNPEVCRDPSRCPKGKGSLS